MIYISQFYCKIKIYLEHVGNLVTKDGLSLTSIVALPLVVVLDCIYNVYIY